jgi:acyl dehydratase
MAAPEEGPMIDRKHIGVVSEPRQIEIEKGQLKFFAKATGETNPIYFDEEAARNAGHRALPAPPTFTFSLALGAPAKRGDVFDDMGVSRAKVLHGEQRFFNHRPMYAGDVITLETRTVDIYDKKGGALEFVVQDTDARNQNGELCTTMRVVTVVRNA